MIMTGSLQCMIIAPDSTIFSGPVRELTVSDRSGSLQILPRHAEMFMAVAPGEIVLRRPDGSPLSLSVSGGVLHFKDDVATVVL